MPSWDSILSSCNPAPGASVPVKKQKTVLYKSHVPHTSGGGTSLKQVIGETWTHWPPFSTDSHSLNPFFDSLSPNDPMLVTWYEILPWYKVRTIYPLSYLKAVSTISNMTTFLNMGDLGVDWSEILCLLEVSAKPGVGNLRPAGGIDQFLCGPPDLKKPTGLSYVICLSFE